MSDNTHSDTYKFWFKHWAEIDYADDCLEELPWDQMVEEYGEDKIQYGIKQEWIAVYNMSGGEITDFPPEYDEEDKDVCVELVFEGENMARASAMLKDDKKYEDDLFEVNDQWGYPFDDGDSNVLYRTESEESGSDSEESDDDEDAENSGHATVFRDRTEDKDPQTAGKWIQRTPSPKRKREDECPPAPKKKRTESQESRTEEYISKLESDNTMMRKKVKQLEMLLTIRRGALEVQPFDYDDETHPVGCTKC